MSAPFPTHASIETAEGLRTVPIQAWLDLPETEKLKALLQEKVQFLADGQLLPLRDALAAMKPPE